jgi:predicted metal-binding membrane protein
MRSVIRFVGGVIAVFIAFWLAVKLLAFLFALIGVILSLVKLAVIVGLIALLGYGVYRFFVPTERRVE